MNFIVSPGQDTVLINRNLNQFISGYAHLYSYDYKMLSKILAVAGFKTRKATFNDSKIKEMQKPLHVIGLEKNGRISIKNFIRKINLRIFIKTENMK